MRVNSLNLLNFVCGRLRNSMRLRRSAMTTRSGMCLILAD